MSVETLDKKMSFSMFVKGIGKKLQGILSKSITPEEKLDLIIAEMEKDTQEKRITAREIRARMVALSDPETATMEPLERMRARKEKLVSVGAQVLTDKENAEKAGDEATAKAKAMQLSQLTQEMKALNPQLVSMETTYQTLKESYDVAMENYRVALGALEHAKNHGKSMLFAIRTHQDALAVRDKAKDSKAVDASFIDDLAEELSKAQSELHSDKQIDKELDATRPSAVIEPPADESIIDEFRKAKK